MWFPTVRTGTGTDVSTLRLASGLADRGIRTEITWLPLHAEYAPWAVPVPKSPEWATVAHVNTWLHPRFLPEHLPVVVSLRHSVHHPALDPYKGLARRLYHRYWMLPFERRVLRRAKVVAAVSQFAAETTRKFVLDRSMQVIYNGVDTNCFRPPQQRTPHQPFRLLYAGSWMARKGVDLLTPIMLELGDAFELRYTGGSAAERCKRSMPRNMHDIGRLRGDDAVIGAMQQADALLFPSRSEGFGLVAAEAMACGLPVIATRGSSLVEVVEDSETGFLCACDDLGSFVAAARTLAEHPDLWDRRSKSARKRAMNIFGMNRMI
ncbi:MAG TPA: glycosyltransferase family 4 protein, partial [Burkholderiales bacterium]|nr:glycosyltransferase family 4 protein [Burkholderiales bacterium]